jgi:hypothetical protein
MRKIRDVYGKVASALGVLAHQEKRAEPTGSVPFSLIRTKIDTGTKARKAERSPSCEDRELRAGTACFYSGNCSSAARIS